VRWYNNKARCRAKENRKCSAHKLPSPLQKAGVFKSQAAPSCRALFAHMQTLSLCEEKDFKVAAQWHFCRHADKAPRRHTTSTQETQTTLKRARKVKALF
jgi:hypothetical protein